MERGVLFWGALTRPSSFPFALTLPLVIPRSGLEFESALTALIRSGSCDGGFEVWETLYSVTGRILLLCGTDGLVKP